MFGTGLRAPGAPSAPPRAAPARAQVFDVLDVVPGIQKSRFLETDIDERRLHPRQYTGHASEDHVADDVAVLRAFEMKLDELVSLEDRHAGFARGSVDQNFVLHTSPSARLRDALAASAEVCLLHLSLQGADPRAVKAVLAGYCSRTSARARRLDARGSRAPKHVGGRTVHSSLAWFLRGPDRRVFATGYLGVSRGSPDSCDCSTGPRLAFRPVCLPGGCSSARRGIPSSPTPFDVTRRSLVSGFRCRFGVGTGGGRGVAP